MIYASTTWTGHDIIKKRLKRLTFKLTGKDPKMLEDIQQVGYQSTATNFESQGRPRWPHRSAQYEAKMLRRYGRLWPILAKTGRLMETVLKSFRGRWKHRGKDHILEIHVPPNKKGYYYGRVHQFGFGLPERRFVNIQPAEDAKIQRIILRHLRSPDL